MRRRSRNRLLGVFFLVRGGTTSRRASEERFLAIRSEVAKRKNQICRPNFEIRKSGANLARLAGAHVRRWGAGGRIIITVEFAGPFAVDGFAVPSDRLSFIP
jgi:hypothetical protein